LAVAIWLILSVLIALAVLGPIFGVDSRDGQDWRDGRFPPAGDAPITSPPGT
jgi:hypothetical protein